MKKFLTAALLILAATAAQAGDTIPAQPERTYRKIPKSYCFRVSFTDKKDCGFSVRHPEEFLSPKAIARRKRYGLKVDAHDLPLTPAYLQKLREMGLQVRNVSKWNNTAVVALSDTAMISEVRKLPFVREARCVWESRDSVLVAEPKPDRLQGLTDKRDTTEHYYGQRPERIEMLRIDSLHRAGYRGAGVTIAILDGGFRNADVIGGLAGARILGTRNFVHPGKSVYEELEHGMNVLSCIAADTPHSLVGTAPEASFYLLVSEDGESEQLVEEDNWAAAIEYADSLGCDVVNSSLGYHQFDYKYMSHRYSDLDGQTALVSRTAALAASRGMLVCNSAGNSGMDAWKKVGVPADAPDILTVGAVMPSKINAPFSSVGHSADGRVKPDVMALGVLAPVYDTDGSVTFVMGTSFSSPILCGAAACLVQAFPKARPVEIIRALQRSGDNAAHPDNVFGYGIPDFVKAYDLLAE